MGRISIDENKLSNSISVFDEKIRMISDTFEKILKTLQDITGENETWRSKVAKEIAETYKNLSNEFAKIDAEFYVYSTFLKDTLENYQYENTKENRAIDTNENRLDV